MKLKKVLPYLDECMNARVFAANNPKCPDEDFKVVYDGWLYDLPKKYHEYHLIKRKDNGGSEAICGFHQINKYGADLDWFRITLVKEKK